MKTININGKEFQYIVNHDLDYDRHLIYTTFYDGTKEVKYKKYFFFGPVMTKTVPNFVFKLPYDIEGATITSDVLQRALHSQVEWLNRK